MNFSSTIGRINKFYIDKYRLSVKLDELNDKISQLVLVNEQKLNIDDKEKTIVIETSILLYKLICILVSSENIDDGL